MKKFLKWGLPAFLAVGSLNTYAQQINPMTEAVMQNYADALAENPKDYYTLYDRASQYLSMEEYARALSDIEMALEYTPAKDSDYRLAEYSLKADILSAQKNYAAAIDALNNALSINPSSKPELYKLGNLQLLSNDPNAALKTFSTLQRESPRSQEAFYGMAKANVMLGNRDEASKLIKEVESLGKQSFITYCRIGDLYTDMGNLKEATSNYVIAYTMEDNSARPVESLKFIARKNYSQVMSALNEIIQSNKENVGLNFVKAILAFDAGKYDEAEQACQALAKDLEQDSAAVYRMMAMSQLAQNRISDATQSIASAEKLQPDNAGVLLDKAEILMSQNPEQAYQAAVKSATYQPDDEPSQLMVARTAILAGKYPEALNALNNIVLVNPSNLEALLLRGYLNEKYLKDDKAAGADYTRASNIQKKENVKDLVFLALAKGKAGKKLDADGLIGEAIATTGNEADGQYLIAVYYAQTGDLQKAKEYADRALLNGYANLYNLQSNPTPFFNLLPLRGN